MAVKPKITVTKTYTMIKFVNGNFTISKTKYSGSGNIHNDIFAKLVEYFDNSQVNTAESVDALFTADFINIIYPGWDVKLKLTFKAGDTVKVVYDGVAYTGKVIKLLTTNATVDFPVLGLSDVSFGMLTKV